MPLTQEQKDIKKEFAKAKREVTEIAGEIHDIVEDTIWVNYDKLPALSQDIQTKMQKVIEIRDSHDFLK
jgi:hypothetical protein